MRGAVEISLGIERQAAHGALPVGIGVSRVEAVEHLLRPGASSLRRHLKDGPIEIDSTGVSYAIQVARAVEDQLAIGERPICGEIDGEIMQYGFGPRAPRSRRQLIDCASVIAPTVVSGSVEIALAVEDQAGRRAGDAKRGTKADQNLFRPRAARCGRNFDDSAGIVSAAGGGSYIDIS